MADVPASRGYSGGFSAALMAKDLRIAMQLAAAASQPLHMGEKAALLYRQVRTHWDGLGSAWARGWEWGWWGQ